MPLAVRLAQAVRDRVKAAKEKIKERATERAAEKAMGKAAGNVAGKAAGKAVRGVGMAGGKKDAGGKGAVGKAAGEQEDDEGNAGGAGGAGDVGDLGDLSTVTEKDVERWVDFYTGMHQQVQLLSGLRHRGTGAVIIAAGIHTLAPRGDEDWSRRLAQVNNLLTPIKTHKHP